jgi:general secretion pathway protein D
MVRDSGTVVIGGLIDDNFSQTEYKVPCLGDIPGLGWLFKTRAKGNEKSNLFIFITPKVIQNPGEASTIFESKKNQIDEMREMQIKLYNGDQDETLSLPIETDPRNEPVPESMINDTGKSGTANSDPIMSITPSAAESADSTASGYHLQVQSFSDQMSAMESVARLKQMGHQAHIAETDVDGKIWYRVQIGGFPDRVAAQMTRDTLSEQGMTDTLIIKNDP